MESEFAELTGQVSARAAGGARMSEPQAVPLGSGTSAAAANLESAVQMQEIHRRQPFRWINVIGPPVVLAVALGIEYMHRWGLRTFFDKPGFLVPSPATATDQSFLDATKLGHAQRVEVDSDRRVIGLAIAT